MKCNDDYYNKERKEEFIEYHSSKKAETDEPVYDKWKYDRIKTVFRKISIFEYRYNKDFCELRPFVDNDFTTDVYREWLSNLTSQTSRNWMSILRAYLKWCRDQGFIDARAYEEHPFFEKYQKKDDKIEGCSLRSAKAIRSIKSRLDDDSEPNVDNDFVFLNENEFFDYIQELFVKEDGRYLMYAVLCCLLYYGFSHKEIPEIKRLEVDEQKRKVRDVIITNDIAFKIICEAKHAESYVVTGAFRAIKYEYPDTQYLLRTRKTPDKINASFIRKILDYEDKAAKELPAMSKYKNIRIKGSTISKLSTFYQMRNDEMIFGSEIVKDKIKNKAYQEPISYQTYWLMLAKAKEIK